MGMELMLGHGRTGTAKNRTPIFFRVWKELVGMTKKKTKLQSRNTPQKRRNRNVVQMAKRHLCSMASQCTITKGERICPHPLLTHHNYCKKLVRRTVSFLKFVYIRGQAIPKESRLFGHFLRPATCSSVVRWIPRLK